MKLLKPILSQIVILLLSFSVFSDCHASQYDTKSDETISFVNYTDSIIRVFDKRTGAKIRLYYSIDWPTEGPEEILTKIRTNILHEIDPENDVMPILMDRLIIPAYMEIFFDKWFHESQDQDWYGENLRIYNAKAEITDNEFLDYDINSYSSLYMQNGTNSPNRKHFHIKLNGDTSSGTTFKNNCAAQFYLTQGAMVLLNPLNSGFTNFEYSDLFKFDGIHPEVFQNENAYGFFNAEGMFLFHEMGAFGLPMAAGEISCTIPYPILIPLLSENGLQEVPSKFIREYEENKETISEIENLIYSLCYNENDIKNPDSSGARYNPLMVQLFKDKGITSSVDYDEIMSDQLKTLHKRIDGVVDNYVKNHPQWYEHYSFDYPNIYLYLLPEYNWPDPLNEFCIITDYNFISPECVKIKIINQARPQNIELIKENGKWKINDVDSLQYDMKRTVKDPSYWLKKNSGI